MAIESKLPIFVHVVELMLIGQAGTFDQKDHDEYFLEPLQNALARRFKNISRRKLSSLLRSKAQEGQLILFLDGWDELPIADRPAVTEWLVGFLGDYQDTQVLLAGPLRGFGPLTEQGFLVSGLLPWRKGQADNLGQLWSGVTDHQEPLPSELYWHPGQSSVESTLRVMQIAETGEDREIEGSPERKVDLLEATLLQSLEQVRLNSPDEWLAPAVRDLWQEVAFVMLSENSLSLPKSQIVALAENILIGFDVSKASKATSQLFRVIANSELFVVYPGDTVSFLCPIWRDYLGASFLAQSDSRKSAIKYFNDSFWFGALRFFTGRVGAMTLLKEVWQNEVTVPEHDLFYLAEWLPEVLDRQQWRRQILVGLGRIVIDQDTPIIWRQRATAALATTEEKGVPALLHQLLSQPEPLMRQIALASMARISPREAILLNERMSGDNDELVRVAAVHALAWIDDPAAEHPLLEALLDPDESVSRAAAEGLALNGTAVSRQIFSEAIVDDAMSVRRAAVYGLALLDDDWAYDLLQEVAQVDSQRMIKNAAGRALQSGGKGSVPMHWKAPQAGEQEWLINWAVTRGQVAPVGSGAIPLVIEALENGDDQIRVEAANTLASLMAKDALEPLQEALADPHPEVRAAAYYALSQIDRAWDGDSSPANEV